jgi:hypothetical protein
MLSDHCSISASRGEQGGGTPPPQMAAWPGKPAATDVVAHATAGEVSATSDGRGRFTANTRISTGDLTANLMHFSTVCVRWSQLRDWNG